MPELGTVEVFQSETLWDNNQTLKVFLREAMKNCLKTKSLPEFFFMQ